MPFPVYKDLDKSITDIFSDDFDTKYTMKIKSAGPAGVVFTTNTQYDQTKDTKLITKLNIKWPHASGFTLEKIEVAANGAVTTETSLVGTAPGLKLEFKGNDSNKGDLSFSYTHPLATVTSEVDALNFAKASTSISGGHGPISAGVSADVNIAKSALGPVSVAVGYSVPKLFQLFFKSNKTFSEYSALASYSVNKDITIAGQALYGTSWQFLFAGQYKCNPDTNLKLKASTNGGVSASVKQSFDKKFSVVGCAEVPKTFDAVKFGVAASLG